MNNLNYTVFINNLAGGLLTISEAYMDFTEFITTLTEYVLSSQPVGILQS